MNLTGIVAVLIIFIIVYAVGFLVLDEFLRRNDLYKYADKNLVRNYLGYTFIIFTIIIFILAFLMLLQHYDQEKIFLKKKIYN